jgi:hypothetical protein
MDINTLFGNFETKVKALAVAQNEVEFALNDIVKVLQGEKGYIEFNDETTYPYFDDDAIGIDAVIAVRYNEDNGLLELLTESQGQKPDDENVQWFDWHYFGKLNLSILEEILEDMVKFS